MNFGDTAGRPLHRTATQRGRALAAATVDRDCESNVEFGNDANTRIESRSAALWERHMGERRRRRPTLPKQRRVGVKRHPMKVPLLINHLDQLRSSQARLRATNSDGLVRANLREPLDIAC